MSRTSPAHLNPAVICSLDEPHFEAWSWPSDWCAPTNIVALRGHLTATAVPTASVALEQWLARAAGPACCIDLFGIEAIDDAGLDLLRQFRHRASDRGVALSLGLESAVVRRAMRVAERNDAEPI